MIKLGVGGSILSSIIDLQDLMVYFLGKKNGCVYKK
jgi:hypothetical protein